MITKTTKRLSDFRHEDFEEFVYEITENNRFDIFNTDENSELYKILTTMKKLPRWKQNMIMLYAHLGSYTNVAKQLNLSVGIVWKTINEIRNEILNDLY